MSGDDKATPEPWEPAYERHMQTVRLVERGRAPELLYDQDYLDTMRRQFFMLGFLEGKSAAPSPGPTMPVGNRAGMWAPGSGGRTAPGDPNVTLKASQGQVTHIRYMQVGEEGWVEPFALIEHEQTQQFGVDVRFDFVPEKDATHTVLIKRLSATTFTGSGPDGCRIYREPLPSTMPRVQYTKEIAGPE